MSKKDLARDILGELGFVKRDHPAVKDALTNMEDYLANKYSEEELKIFLDKIRNNQMLISRINGLKGADDALFKSIGKSGLSQEDQNELVVDLLELQLYAVLGCFREIKQVAPNDPILVVGEAVGDKEFLQALTQKIKATKNMSKEFQKVDYQLGSDSIYGLASPGNLAVMHRLASDNLNRDESRYTDPGAQRSQSGGARDTIILEKKDAYAYRILCLLGALHLLDSGKIKERDLGQFTVWKSSRQGLLDAITQDIRNMKKFGVPKDYYKDPNIKSRFSKDLGTIVASARLGSKRGGNFFGGGDPEYDEYGLQQLQNKSQYLQLLNDKFTRQ